MYIPNESNLSYLGWIYLAVIGDMCAIASNFGSLGWFSLSWAVNRCWQLLTADDSCLQLMTAATKKLNGIFIYNLKVICMLNFSSLCWFLFLSAVNRCWQLLTAVDSWWQLLQKNLKWNFHLHPNDDVCAKLQLFSLIFIFISCQQMLSAVDICSVAEN